MSEWWIILVALAIIVAAFLVMRRRNAGLTGSSVSDPTRNYTGERETDRLGGMSDEDRAWETASLERNRQREARERPPQDG
jgi:hypothetical protein